MSLEVSVTDILFIATHKILQPQVLFCWKALSERLSRLRSFRLLIAHVFAIKPDARQAVALLFGHLWSRVTRCARMSTSCVIQKRTLRAQNLCDHKLLNIFLRVARNLCKYLPAPARLFLCWKIMPAPAQKRKRLEQSSLFEFTLLCPRQESNLQLPLRTGQLYPFNYEGIQEKRLHSTPPFSCMFYICIYINRLKLAVFLMWVPNIFCGWQNYKKL